jgi:hypothetical protein
MAGMWGSRPVAACLALALLVAGPIARAADAPDGEPTPPAIAPSPPVTPLNAAPPPAPALEAGDTAPTAAAPLPAVETQPTPDPQSRTMESPVPFYRRPWFWGGLIAVSLTAAIVSTFVLGTSEAPKPQTTLGDMNAF